MEAGSPQIESASGYTPAAPLCNGFHFYRLWWRTAATFGSMSDVRAGTVRLSGAGGWGGWADLSESRKVKDWNSWGGSADLDQSVGRSSVKVYSQAIKHKQFVRTSWKCLMVKVCGPLCFFSYSFPFIFYNQPARILHVFWVKIEISAQKQHHLAYVAVVVWRFSGILRVSVECCDENWQMVLVTTSSKSLVTPKC